MSANAKSPMIRQIALDVVDQLRIGVPDVEMAETPNEAVVLLHGLGRGRMSLFRLEATFRDAGYHVVNRSYPSTALDLTSLADRAVGDALRACPAGARVHFVTHSMGGILLRAYFASRSAASLGWSVMFGPPNRGSEIVDLLSRVGAAKMLLGPSGAALGAAADGPLADLPDLDAPFGVIAGSRSLYPLTSALIYGPNDGKVSVESTKTPGAADHIVLPVSHSFMIADTAAIRQAAHFLRHGVFDHDAAAEEAEDRDETCALGSESP